MHEVGPERLTRRDFDDDVGGLVQLFYPKRTTQFRDDHNMRRSLAFNSSLAKFRNGQISYERGRSPEVASPFLQHRAIKTIPTLDSFVSVVPNTIPINGLQ